MPTHSSDWESSWPRFNTSLSQTLVNRQQSLRSLPSRQRGEHERERKKGRDTQRERETGRGVYAVILPDSSKAQRMRLQFISLLSLPSALWIKPNHVTLLPSWGQERQLPTTAFHTEAVTMQRWEGSGHLTIFPDYPETDTLTDILLLSLHSVFNSDSALLSLIHACCQML